MNREIEEILSLQDAVRLLDGLEKQAGQKGCFGSDIFPSQFPYGLFFRGHADHQYTLTPTIFRNPQKCKDMEYGYAFSEEEIFENARRRFRFSTREPMRPFELDLDWLCLFQHYEIPTRLLDWTENLIVALYFTVADSEEHNAKDGKIIVLNARRLNALSAFTSRKLKLVLPQAFSVKARVEMAQCETRKKWAEKVDLKADKLLQDVGQNEVLNIPGIDALAKFFGKENTKFTAGDLEENNNLLFAKLFSLPVAVIPNHVNERMYFQASVFTLHGGKLYRRDEKENDRLPAPFGLEAINNELCGSPASVILHEWVIPSGQKPKIRKQLANLGYHGGVIKPELEYQSHYYRKLEDQEGK